MIRVMMIRVMMIRVIMIKVLMTIIRVIGDDKVMIRVMMVTKDSDGY